MENRYLTIDDNGDCTRRDLIAVEEEISTRLLMDIVLRRGDLQVEGKLKDEFIGRAQLELNEMIVDLVLRLYVGQDKER